MVIIYAGSILYTFFTIWSNVVKYIFYDSRARDRSRITPDALHARARYLGHKIPRICDRASIPRPGQDSSCVRANSRQFLQRACMHAFLNSYIYNIYKKQKFHIICDSVYDSLVAGAYRLADSAVCEALASTSISLGF